MKLTESDTYNDGFFKDIRDNQKRRIFQAFEIFGRSPDFLFETVASAFKHAEHTSKVINTVIAPPIQCKVRCSFCCTIPVSVTAPEIVCLAEALKDNGDNKALIEKLSQVNSRIQDFDLLQHIAAKVPCALLLKSGECSIYDVRPLVCRSWTSYSRKACEIAARDPLSSSTPVDFHTRAATQAVIDGTSNALRELGLDTNCYELHSALLTALKTERLMERYLLGENVFLSCKSYGEEPQMRYAIVAHENTKLI